MGSHYNPRIVTNGLVLHLDAANIRSYPGSGTVWSDICGRNNNGTLTNGPLFDSDRSGCIDLDGTNDYVNLPLSSELTTLNGSNLTICAWFYLRVGGLLFSPRGGVLNSLYYSIAETTCILDRYPPSGSTAITTTITSPTNAWSFYAVSAIAGVNATFYQNLNSQTLPHTEVYSGTTPTAVTIGCQIDNGTPANHINGKLAVFSIYNRALSASEIRQNFNATRGRFGI